MDKARLISDQTGRARKSLIPLGTVPSLSGFAVRVPPSSDLPFRANSRRFLNDFRDLTTLLAGTHQATFRTSPGPSLTT
jgi:hypothetical protein